MKNDFCKKFEAGKIFFSEKKPNYLLFIRNDKIFNVYKIGKTKDKDQMPPPLFNYFVENSDEILHLQSICFSVEDIIFLTELIGRDVEKFKDLPKYIFFTKTYTTRYRINFRYQHTITPE